MTQNTVKETSFSLPQTESLYRGKVRDVYFLKNDLLVMVASDRISAFDVILPEAIPYKGQVLSKIATRFMELLPT
jgi:phosphoribosylaminoimidazole-succinocarboxamide synthase